MSSWVEVSEERLAGNYRALCRVAGAATTVLAVVKANAYGHGAEVCAAALVRAGAAWLGVSDAREGARVRAALDQAGLEAEILVMCGFLPEDVAGMRGAGLTPVVWTREQVDWLQGLGVGRVHVEVDTGMGRQGVRPGAELESLLCALALPGLVVNGVMTHFACAEEIGSGLTQTQEQRFAEAMRQVRERELRPRWIHAGSTSSVDNPAQEWPWLEELAGSVGARAMVRTGLGLYGYSLPTADARVRAELRPVMTWKTRVLAVRELSAGETVGYNATFTARAAMRVAVLGVGYADGLRRELSSANDRAGGWVVIAGRLAAVLGRISMNLTVVDVTGITGVRAGDEAVLLGDGVTAEDHARLAGTIAYEILCGVRPCS